jgi:uncharacterized protein (DUF1697 family)
MARLVAFLRAINVGGHIVRMDALRRLFEEQGFTQVSTFIASGNVIFSTRAKPDGLSPRIEKHLRQALGYEVPTFLRTDAQVAEIAAYQPFPPALLSRARTSYVGLLATDPGEAGQHALRTLASSREHLRLHGREVYWLTESKLSESKLSYAAFEKALKTRATFRGMNTVERLSARLASGIDD